MRTRLILPFIAAMTVAAQVLPPKQTVIRATTRLVEVNVIVRDENGPVAGLTKDDFSIFDGGTKRNIALFLVNSVHDLPKPPEPLPRNVFTNRAEMRTEMPNSITVVLLDGLNTRFADQAYAKTQFIKFLSQIRPEDRVAVYALGSRLRVLNEFTNDSKRLVAALARYRGENGWQVDASEPDAADTGSVDLDAMLDQANGVIADYAMVNRVRGTCAAMEAIANHVSRLPGRKNLIWVSSSFPFAIGLETFNRERRTFTEEVARASRALNNAGVSVYPVDARGLVGVPESMTALAGSVSSARAVQPQHVSMTPSGLESMRVIAETTGGRAFYNTNDIQGAIHKAVQDSEVTYTLGFYLDSTKLDSKFHELKVRVDRNGLDVRHRKGYTASAENQPTDQERKLAISDAIWSPLDATGISLTASLDTVDQPKSGTLRLMFSISPADITLQHKDNQWTGAVDVIYVQRSADGRSLETVSETIQMNLESARYEAMLKQGLIVTKVLDRAAEATEVRIVLVDHISGKLGSLAMPVRK
jgi:VWFA-related protein